MQDMSLHGESRRVLVVVVARGVPLPPAAPLERERPKAVHRPEAAFRHPEAAARP